MARHILYLSPQFPENYIQFVLRLRRLGAQVFGVGSDWFGALPQQLRESMTEYYQVHNMTDYGQLLQAGRYFAGKYGWIDHIESHTEFWMPYEAALREDLGVPGKKRSDMPPIRQKSVMKEWFRSAGIPVARGEVCDSERDARHFLRECGPPIIAKPDEGVGAAATFKINSEEELQEFFSSKPPVSYFFEEFVKGQICTFDGLTDGQGEPVYFNSLTYSSGIMEVVNEDEHVYYYTARRIAEDLEQAGRTALRVFDVRKRFFHFEFFRRESDNALLGLEVNIRPPGGLTTDMWNYADDIDLYDQWARIVAEDRFTASWSRQRYAMYISRKDRFSYVHSHDEVLRLFRHLLCHWTPISPIFSRALGNTGYILRSESLDELLDAAAVIHSRYPY